MAVNNSVAVAQISQRLDISQSQVNACLGTIGDDGNSDDTDTTDDTDTATDAENDVMASTVPETDELPNTGGPSLLALGARLALVAGAASLIRFRR